MLHRFYLDWVLGRAWIFVLLFLGIGVWMGTYLPQFELSAGTSTLTLDGDDSKRVYDETRDLFTNDDYVLIAVIPDDPWSPEGIELVADLTRRLEEIPNIVSVVSPTTMDLLASKKSGPGTTTLTSPDVDIEKARKELTQSPLFRNQLATADGRAFNLAAYFAADTENLRKQYRDLKSEVDAKDAPTAGDLAALERLADEVLVAKEQERRIHRQVVGEVRALLPEFRARGAEIHASGLPTLVVDMVDYLEHDIWWFGGAVTIFLLLTLTVLFRRFRFVFFPMVTCLLTVVTIMGLMVLTEVETTVVTSNISSLLFIIGMAHSIHLVVKYREERALHPDREYHETLWRAVSGILRPCLYTALTTCVGFGSLVVTGIGPVEDFAIFMALGVLMAFLVSMLFLPACLALLSPTEEQVELATSERRNPLLSTCAELAVQRRPLVYAVCLVLTAIGVYGLLQVTVDTRFVDYFREDTEVHQGIKFIDQVGGTMTLEVILEGDEPGYWLEEENYAKLAVLHDWFEQLPQTGKALSVVSFREHVKMTMPFTQAMPLKFLLTMAKSSLGPEKVDAALRMVAEPTMQTTRVYVRLKETSEVLDRQQILDDLREFLATEPSLKDEKTTVTGMFLLFSNMLNTLIDSQVSSFLWVFVAVALMFTMLLWHPGVGLLAMPPNMLPILMVLGTMGFAAITLDLMTIMIASIALGIAADATIHYLVRFREEVRQTGDFDLAVRVAHQSIGKAILYTAITVFAGFFVMVLSKFTPTIYFGVLVGVAMVAGLLADLLLLPSMLLTFRPFRKEAVKALAEAQGRDADAGPGTSEE